jgi:hypothetical protein
MSELLSWYRSQSGEYSNAEMQGLASRLDVGAPTMRREEYDAGWMVNSSLRQSTKKEQGEGERNENGGEEKKRFGHEAQGE